MKLKKIKKAAALSLALAIAATTNTGGLQNAVKIEAATQEVYAETTVSGITWVYTETNGNKSTTVKNKNELINADVTVPKYIKGHKVTELDSEVLRGTKLRSLTIDNPDLIINGPLCENCDKLEWVDIRCKRITGAGNGRTPCCTFSRSSVKKANINTEFIGMLAFSECDKLEEVNISSPINSIEIGISAFYLDDSLEKITFSDTLKGINFNDSAFENCSKVKKLLIPGDVKLGNNVFASCRNLRNVEFSGIVSSMGEGVFSKSFLIEKEEEKQVEKTITFSNSVQIGAKTFENCEGLTNVVLSENSGAYNHFNGDNIFENCKSLCDINFGKGFNSFDGNSIFSNCYQLKTITGNRMYFTADKVLLGSYIEKIELNQDQTLNIDLDKKTIPLKEIVVNHSSFIGKINLNNLPKMQSIIFTNPQINTCNVEVTGSSSKTVNVYGYSKSIGIDNTSDGSVVEGWAGRNTTKGLIFKNIVSRLYAEYKGEPIIGTTDINAVDKSKFYVEASKILQGTTEEIKPSSDGTDISGYILKLPEKLKYGKNKFIVIYSNNAFSDGEFEVIRKQPSSIDVDWKENEISQLVSKQPIKISDVISGASITYNDGDIKTVSADKLVLNKSVTVTGDNTFEVTFVDEDGFKISAEKTFTIQQNYITSIKAEYQSDKTLYVGDEIDISKIKLTPVYKYDADNTVNRNITATNCETELKEAGANILKVYYNGMETTMVVSASAVTPTKMYAMFDTDYTYIEGQKSIDPNSIVTTVEYNNGTSKTIPAEEITYEIIQQTSSELQVKVSYAGLESVVTIPVTPKQIVAIKAKANIASATEGATLPKAIIDQIEVTYNNGNTETLDSTAINYDELTFNDYAIVADTQNVITVNYLGKSTEITVVGISNTIINIYAEYIGSGQIVGTEVPVSDVAVHAINSNGQITDVTTGVLLENAIPYNVGNNTVTVHYGSLSCTVTVNGLPAPEVPSATPSEMPGATADVTDKEPAKTEAPVNTVAPTNKPEVTASATPTVPVPTSSIVVVTTPDNANSAPVVANTVVTVKASNAKITAATTDTYKVYTNKKVDITIDAVGASDIKYQIVAKGGKVSDTAWKNVTNNKITVFKTAKPSIVYIQYKDASGAVQMIHTNGFAVDTKKATVNIKQNKTYKAGKKVTFKDASGIKTAKLDGKKTKSGVKIKKKGLHILVVTDKAGNQTVIKFKIK